ncbi:MAG TPA: 7TM domain-containing protein [Patescibacteria group bacterium]
MWRLIAILLVSACLGLLLGFLFLNTPSYFSSNIVVSQGDLGSAWLNPAKYAIRSALSVGVSLNTIVLLLLLPVVASFIAGVRHIVGLKSFGIFLPAALSVVFVALGPVIGIGLFLLIVGMSTLVRMLLRKTKVRLQYLPRMAFILWGVVIAVLFLLYLAPILGVVDLSSISIFPVFILILLAEDFTRVQLGKSVRTAVNLTTETLILGLSSYLILSFTPLQEFAVTNPEALLIIVAIFDLILGRYVGLRFLEFWRFRKLLTS